MRPLFKKITLVISIITAVLITLELSLWAAGKFIFQKNQVSPVLAEDESKIRILTLGESTTADYSDQKSWPRHLEELLVSQGHQVKVYNLAKAGTSSAFILAGLKNQIDLYRPHIVISMMGINDAGNLSFDYATSRLRIFRFISILKERLVSVSACSLNVNATIFNHEELYAMSLTEPAKLQDLENELRKQLKSDSRIATSLALMAYSYKIKNSSYSPPKIKFLHERAFELDPLNEKNTIGFLNYLNDTKDKMCLKVSQAILQCGVNLSDEVLSKIVDCTRITGSTLDFTVLNNRGVSVLGGEAGILRKHYRQLAEMLDESGIPLVAMQYPTLPVMALKDHFTGPENRFTNLHFVSNEKNFEQALMKYKFEDIFTDKFRGSWGHTTDLGHKIIATSALEEVGPIVKSLSRK